MPKPFTSLPPTELEPVVGNIAHVYISRHNADLRGPLAGIITEVLERDEKDHARARITVFPEREFAVAVRMQPMRVYDRLTDRAREVLLKADVPFWAEWPPKSKGRRPTEADEPKEPEKGGGA